jgi:hypothetical protein
MKEQKKEAGTTRPLNSDLTAKAARYKGMHFKAQMKCVLAGFYTVNSKISLAIVESYKSQSHE